MAKSTTKKKKGAAVLPAKVGAVKPQPIDAPPTPAAASGVQPDDQDASGWTADEVLDQINLDFANGQRSLFFGDNGTLFYRQC